MHAPRVAVAVAIGFAVLGVLALVVFRTGRPRFLMTPVARGRSLEEIEQWFDEVLREPIRPR